MDQALFPIITAEDQRLPFYLTSIGGRESQEHILRPEGYKEYHWLHGVKGKGKLLISGKEYIIHEDTGFFLCPNIAHEYYALTESWSTHWATFNGNAVPPLLDIAGINQWGIYNLIGMPGIENILQSIYHTTLSENAQKSFECSVLLYKFIFELKNAVGSSNTNQKLNKQKKLQPVLVHMEKNYNKSPSLEEMASIIGVTPQHLCRLFKQVTDLRPFEYLTFVRIQKAKGLLLEPDKAPIKEISQRLGYNDPSYFCAVFKEYERMTPMEFRQQHRSW